MNDLKNIPVFIVVVLIAWILFESIMFSRTIGSIPLPEPPRLSQDTTESVQGAKSKEIENYKNLISAMHSRRLTVYENVVSKTLMPIFNSFIAAVLGYIFANKAAEAYTSYLAEKSKRNSKS